MSASVTRVPRGTDRLLFDLAAFDRMLDEHERRPGLEPADVEEALDQAFPALAPAPPPVVRLFRERLIA